MVSNVLFAAGPPDLIKPSSAIGAGVVHEEVRSAHMTDVHLRRVLEHSLGTDTHLVVAKFVNYGASIREQSIPTPALALERFQVGVLASTSDWFGAGLLSEVHVAMLLLPSRAIQRHSAASTRMRPVSPLPRTQPPIGVGDPDSIAISRSE